MHEIEIVAAAAVAGGTDATTVTPLFAALLPAFEYLPVMPPLPLAGFGDV